MKTMIFRRFIFNNGYAKLAFGRTGQVASFKAMGFQNARTYLWKIHHISAPNGEKKSETQVGNKVVSSQPSITSFFSFDRL
jgi:hypothetical protein